MNKTFVKDKFFYSFYYVSSARYILIMSSNKPERLIFGNRIYINITTHLYIDVTNKKILKYK